MVLNSFEYAGFDVQDSFEYAGKWFWMVLNSFEYAGKWFWMVGLYSMQDVWNMQDSFEYPGKWFWSMQNYEKNAGLWNMWVYENMQKWKYVEMVMWRYAMQWWFCVKCYAIKTSFLKGFQIAVASFWDGSGF